MSESTETNETFKPIVRNRTDEVDVKQRKAEAKAIDNGAEQYFYPEHDVVIIAVDQESADEALNKHVSERK